MKILYIYAHPREDSFNAWLKDLSFAELRNSQHEIITSDLYAEHFNPLASWEDFKIEKKMLPTSYFLAQLEAFRKNKLATDINAELEKISWAQHIIFQFPLWWFNMPAILKGWLDRILVKGFAYDTNFIFSQGLLKGKTASVTTSTQSPESAFKLEGLHKATIDNFLLPIHHTLHFVGIKTLSPLVIFEAFKIEKDRLKTIEAHSKKYLHHTMENHNTK